MISEASVSQENMNIVFVGHVDHGKSTVVGRLLADTGVLPEGKLEAIQAYCEKNSRPFEYAFLIDALKEERKQNITIDSARVFFVTPRRRYIIIDAPGHIEFVKNMVTGAARAEGAVLVIDAIEGVKENSRRHAYLLSMLGIRQIIVAINKMDLVDYQEATYLKIKAEIALYLKKLGIKAAAVIPVSARQGDNMVTASANMAWYEGEPLLENLDHFQKNPPLEHLPVRMPVQEVYRFTRFGDNRRIVAGKLESGLLNTGDEVTFYPSGKHAVVKTVEAFPEQKTDRVETGFSTGITLEPQIYVRRGELLAKTQEQQPVVSSAIRVSLFWMGKEALDVNREYLLKINTSRVKCHIGAIHQIVDPSENGSLGANGQVKCYDVADCTLILDRPIAFDSLEALVTTRRFVLVDQYQIIGGGIITDTVKSDLDWIRDGVYVREKKWIYGLITPEKRQEKYQQKPCLIIITGQKGNSRKDTARLLEESLFNRGQKVYYLGLGSVLYGVDADLKRKDHPTFHNEYIRRMAEVAHLFLDAGLILILTAIELRQEDLQIFETIIDPQQIKIIWVGEAISTDIQYQLHLPRKNTLEEEVLDAIHFLGEEKIIPAAE